MIKPGDIISYIEMCNKEKSNSLQKGMHFKKGIILMSTRKNAPYEDRVEDNGNILIYEGHDVNRKGDNNPKIEDQPLKNKNGKLTQNGEFYYAALEYKKGERDSKLIKVYEKIKSGIWVYNGVFKLIDAWQEECNNRKVFKFKLEITNKREKESFEELEHNRIIPTSVKLEVWKRDKGKCITCGSEDNLHFDHIIPFSKGGTSLKAENIQLLCARHNLSKSNKII